MAMAMVRQLFTRHPVLANCSVYGSLYVGAEFAQQMLCTRLLDRKDPPKPIDTGSLARYAVVGTLIYPNTLYQWYKWLDGRFVGTATKTIVKKLLLDQFLLTPNLLVVFFVSMSIMERKSNVVEECVNKFVPTFTTSCVFWLPAQALNFWFIPPAARVVYVGACAFIWVNILCWIKRNP